MNWCHVDGFSSMGARTSAIKLAMAAGPVLRIGGADFSPLLGTDSILLERAGSLITKR